MNDNAKIKELKAIIEKSHKIALFGHTSPDGDAIGAILGFGKILEKLGKNISYFTPTKPKEIFNFVKDIKHIQTKFDYGDYDTIIFLDFTPPHRINEFFEGHEQYFKEKTIIQIDHHLESAESRINLTIKDSSSISTCEILFEYAYDIRPKLFDKNIATHLYMGIITDSGNFKYEKDSIRTFGNAIKLIKLGADKKTILNGIYNHQSMGSIILLQRILQRITTKNNFIYSYYLEEELPELNIDDGNSQKALDIMLSIKESDIILLLKTNNGKIKGSLRSKGNIDCTKIAQLFNGGGHYNAAGFAINTQKNFEETKIKIIKEINKYLLLLNQ